MSLLDWVSVSVSSCTCSPLPLLATAAAGLFSYVYFTAIRCPPAELDESLVLELGRQAAGKSADQLLLGKVAIVTGSTSGIGQEIALQLYKLNCTVIIASRSPKKCDATAQQLRDSAPKSQGKIAVIPLNICDLENVLSFVSQIKKEYKELNFLVNNAGMMYLTGMEKASPESPLRSPQGYDLAFATNFMGHFLLTELLLPLLKVTPGARILNIASSVHLQVNGDALRPPDGGAMPLAARSDVYTTRHWIDSYGNSKLAQLLHMRELQALLDNDSSTDLQVVSVCPGFVNTSMVPDRPIARFISRFFFSSRAATLAPLAALLDPSVKGGEWLTNFNMIWTSNTLPYCYMTVMGKLGMRDLFVSAIATPQVVLFQNSSYGLHHSPMSSFATDRSLSESFYAWCLEETKKYRK